MKYKVNRNLRCIPSLYEHPGTIRENGVSVTHYFRFRLGNATRGCALMLAKFRVGQTVVRDLCFRSAHECGNGESPLTIRAGPAGYIAVGPDQIAQHIATSTCYSNNYRDETVDGTSVCTN